MFNDAKRAWQFYVDDIIDFRDKVIAYTDGLTKMALCNAV